MAFNITFQHKLKSKKIKGEQIEGNHIIKPTKYNESEMIQREKEASNMRFCFRERKYIIENISFVILMEFSEK